jgi:hypothetical protein
LTGDTANSGGGALLAAGNVSVSNHTVTREELRSFLVTDFGAVPRPTWGLDARYREGRLFAIFDGWRRRAPCMTVVIVGAVLTSLIGA